VHAPVGEEKRVDQFVLFSDFFHGSFSVVRFFCHWLMQANLPGLTESVACTTIQLRVAKEIIDKQWNVIQEDRARLEEELERFAREKENYEQERRNFETERTWVAQNMVEDKVCLCVGGKYMATSRNTLMAKEGSMLSAMFSGRHKLALSLGMWSKISAFNFQMVVCSLTEIPHIFVTF
jgi:hypothetical protein